MSKQTQSSMLLVGVLAGGIGLMAFLVSLVIGDFGFNASLFFALLLTIAVALFLFFAFHRSPEGPSVGAPAAKPAPAPRAAAPAPAPEPAAAPAPAPAPAAEGTKPATLSAPRDGGADDLKKIKGVGPKLEQMLHGMGFYHFDQVANWTAEEVAWVDENLEGFKGRVSRDNWVEQAKTLASGGETEFSKKVEGGDVY